MEGAVESLLGVASSVNEIYGGDNTIGQPTPDWTKDFASGYYPSVQNFFTEWAHLWSIIPSSVLLEASTADTEVAHEWVTEDWFESFTSYYVSAFLEKPGAALNDYTYTGTDPSKNPKLVLSSLLHLALTGRTVAASTTDSDDSETKVSKEGDKETGDSDSKETGDSDSKETGDSVTGMSNSETTDTDHSKSNSSPGADETGKSDDEDDSDETSSDAANTLYMPLGVLGLAGLALL